MMGPGFGEALAARMVKALVVAGVIVLTVGAAIGFVAGKLFQ